MKFSIVITTYNRLSLLKRAVESALAQTEPCQVIVVDNGSSDGTDTYLSNLGEKITYWRNERNLGHSAAINAGVRLAGGTWIKPLDDDDYLAPNGIETMSRIIARHPQAVICSYQAVQVNMAGEEISCPCGGEAEEVFYIPQADIHYGMLLEQVPFGTTSQVAFQKNAFLRSQGWDINLDICDEIDAWIRIAQYGDAIFINSYLTYRTVWSGGYNQKSSLHQRLASNILMKEKIYALVDSRHRSHLPSLESIRHYLQLHWLLVALKQKEVAVALSLAFPTIFFPSSWKLLADARLWRTGRQENGRIRRIPIAPKETAIDVTVVICTYNGEARLPKVLDCLLRQVETETFSWEILVIDNNSSDRTSQAVHEYQKRWPTAHPLRYGFEGRQGLAFARRLAVRQARGELIAFLDDDNWPAENWVAAVYNFGQDYPQAGAFGSKILGEYEVEPPANFNQIACFLGIIDRSPQPFRYDLLTKWLFPAGAGMVVRKQAWLESVPDTFILSGVTGRSLLAKGEDVETLSYVRRSGWQVWHNPEMVISHYIPKERLEYGYLMKLFRGVGLSRYPTRMLQSPAWQKPFRVLLYLVNDLLKLAIHYYRSYPILHSDLIARCRLELLIYSLVSPFYHWGGRWGINTSGFRVKQGWKWKKSEVSLGGEVVR